MSKNGTMRNCRGGTGMPTKPVGRRAAVRAPTIPRATMATASPAPSQPSLRCRSVRRTATSAGCTTRSTSQAVNTTPCTKKTGSVGAGTSGNHGRRKKLRAKPRKTVANIAIATPV